MNCKTSKVRSFIGSIFLVIGVLVGVLAHFVTTNTNHSVDYLYGVSFGLMVASIGILIVSFIRNKNAKYRNQDLINEQDERNQMIALRAASISFTYLFYGIAICFLINLFITLSFHYVAFFFIVSAPIVQFIAAYYYSKKY